MDANKILSAPLLDLVFDGRNKDYGAYELRKTNSVRTRTALSVTISIVALVLSVVTMANASKKRDTPYKVSEGYVISEVPEIPPEEIPPPEKLPEPEPVRTAAFTTPAIVEDELVDKPIAEIADLDSAQFASETTAGRPDIFEEPQKEIDKGTGIIPPKEVPDDVIVDIVEVPARFIGDWTKFLIKNLNPETPVEHSAPAGRYSVVVQFVVDKEGMVSDIKTLTNHGYGMEEEAARVLKKAPKWEPGIQNGHKVKAYHRQVITFEVNEE